MKEEKWTVEAALSEALIQQIASASKEGEIILSFLAIIHQLKSQKRTGWIDYHVQNPESIADHMYRMALITMLVTDVKVNRDHMLKLAIVHDMAEAIVGDITPVDPIPKSEKSRREEEAIRFIARLIRRSNGVAADEIEELWLEYEHQTSTEAAYVKDIDKYELLVQALDYETRDKCSVNLSSLFNARSLIKTKQICEWADEVLRKREKLWLDHTGQQPPL